MWRHAALWQGIHTVIYLINLNINYDINYVISNTTCSVNVTTVQVLKFVEVIYAGRVYTYKVHSVRDAWVCRGLAVSLQLSDASKLCVSCIQHGFCIHNIKKKLRKVE